MKIAIASNNVSLKSDLYEAINKFERLKETSVEVVEFQSYLEMINESQGDEAIIFTDESLVNSEEELHFLKILKNKNAGTSIVHIYKKFVPFTMDEFVINATSKFLKLDSNISKSALRSLSVLAQKELRQLQYGC